MNSLSYTAKLPLAVAILLGVAPPVLAESIPLPPGWRMPSNSELSDDWRNDAPNKYSSIIGDFNGDGFSDHAMLLISQKENGLGLFVFMAKKNHTFKIYMLDKIGDESLVRAMGIAKVPPGQYKTACGKGYWDCKKGEAPDILIKHEAIGYFKTESASSYFYWNEQAKLFKRAWISD